MRNSLTSILILIITVNLHGQISKSIQAGPRLPANNQMSMLFIQYGADIKSAPVEAASTASLFLKNNVIEKPLLVPRDPMHGNNRAYEQPFQIALLFANKNDSTALRAAQMLALNESCSLGLRSASLQFLKSNKQLLLETSEKLADSANSPSRSVSDRHNKALAIRGFSYLEDISQKGKELIISEISSPTLHIEDSLIPTLSTGHMTPSKVDVCLDIALLRPAYSDVVMTAIRNASPDILRLHAEELDKFYNNAANKPEARASAAIALDRIGQPVPTENLITLIGLIKDENDKLLLLKSIKGKHPLTAPEKEKLQSLSQNQSFLRMLSEM